MKFIISNVKKVLTFWDTSYIITFASQTGDEMLYGIGTTRWMPITSGCGSAWLERLVWDQEAAGSNPVTPIYIILLIL